MEGSRIMPFSNIGLLAWVAEFPHYDGLWAEWDGTFRNVTRNCIKVRQRGFDASLHSINANFCFATKNRPKLCLILVCDLPGY